MLTNNDQINILGAVMAKSLGCKSNLVLINSTSFHQVTDALGIDAQINPRAVTISRVLQHVRKGRIRSVYAVENGAAEIIEAEALETSPLVGRPFRELDLPEGVPHRRHLPRRGGDPPERRHQDQGPRPGRAVAAAEAVRHVEQLFRVSIQYF